MSPVYSKQQILIDRSGKDFCIENLLPVSLTQSLCSQECLCELHSATSGASQCGRRGYFLLVMFYKPGLGWLPWFDSSFLAGMSLETWDDSRTSIWHSSVTWGQKGGRQPAIPEEQEVYDVIAVPRPYVYILSRYGASQRFCGLCQFH